MLYIFHGPDDFTRNEKIAEFRASLGDPAVADLNMTLLKGADLKLGDIRHHADAMPFMADKRVVIVNGYLSQLSSQAPNIEKFVEYMERVPPTTDLILVEQESLGKNHPILKVASTLDRATVVHFGAPDKNHLGPWIINKAKEHNATIEPGAAELLGRLVGTDLRTLDNEIEKLTLYVGEQRPIQRADIDLLVPYHEESDNFGLANAIGQTNAHKAYDQMHKMLAEDKHPMAILGTIAFQIRSLIEVKDMVERGLSATEIAQRKNWKNEYAATMRMREAANFSLSRLEEILEILLQVDLAIKTGRTDRLLALDTLIARLCVVGRDQRI